jgi:glutathione S-transferase
MKVISCIAFVASLAQTSTAFAAGSISKPMELKYFDLRGAAETARIILAIGGEEYTDTRYAITPGSFDAPEFKAAKESGDLDMNLGRAPLLITEEGTIGQSKAIERFLAKKFGLMGSTDFEAAQIDCISEHCRDVKDASAKKGFSAFTRDKTDEEKAAARKEWFESDMPAMLEKVEKSVALTSGKDGFAVGSNTSYADIAIFSLLQDCTLETDAEDTSKAAEKCSNLLAIANRIAGEENVAKYVESRPKTMF